MRRWLPILVLLGLAAMAAVALAQVGSAPRAQAQAIAASGSFEISNSHEGQPIFAATGIVPGGSAQGTVTIENTGSEPVALLLRRGALIDTPGPGGGVLSGRLRLTVVDVTEPAAPRTVYSGPLDSMPDQPAGNLEGGEARTFEFTATLPESGAPGFQNAVQGASTTVAYSWVAGETSGGGGGESPGGGGGPDAPPAPGAGGGSGGQSGGGAVPTSEPLGLTVPRVRLALHDGRLVAWTTCSESCYLHVRGRVRATGVGATGARTHRGAKIRFARKRLYAPGPQRLRIPVPRGLRRWMRETPGHERLRAKLRFIAIGTNGERAAVRKTVKLRVRGR
jgi:hypothetical protein